MNTMFDTINSYLSILAVMCGHDETEPNDARLLVWGIYSFHITNFSIRWIDGCRKSI